MEISIDYLGQHSFPRMAEAPREHTPETSKPILLRIIVPGKGKGPGDGEKGPENLISSAAE